MINRPKAVLFSSVMWEPVAREREIVRRKLHDRGRVRRARRQLHGEGDRALAWDGNEPLRRVREPSTYHKLIGARS